jgi:hypothetical protein
MRIEIEKKKENHAFYLVGDRKKRNNRQSDHYTLSHVTPCKRGHSDTFKETIEGQVWLLGDITRIA